MKLFLVGNVPVRPHSWQGKARAKQLQKGIIKVIQFVRPDVAFVGLAVGPDQIAAEACLKTKTPYIVVLPYKYCYLKQDQHFRNNFLRLKKRASGVVLVDRQKGYISHSDPPDFYALGKAQRASNWMKDQAEPTDAICVVSWLPKQRSLSDRILFYQLYDKVRQKYVVGRDGNDFRIAESSDVEHVMGLRDFEYGPPLMDYDDVPF